MGQPLRTGTLRDLLALAEQRLHLLELRYQLRPVSGGCELVLVPVHRQTQSVDVSLGYESTLAGMAGFRYRTENLGGFGAEGELTGTKNRLQQAASLSLRRPFESFLGAGLEAQASYLDQRFESRLSFGSPEIPDPGKDARVSTVGFALGTSVRFGNLGQGKAEVKVGQQRAIFRQDALDQSRQDRAVELVAEWDNFDRHTFPREGLLLRGRYGLGDAQPGLAPEGAFRFGYLRARGMQPLGSVETNAELSLDLDLEWGYGRHLPMDRWWVAGGPSFLAGSSSLGVVTPNFGAVRLGVPLRVDGPFGLSLQVSPRFDYLVLSDEPRDLFRGLRAQGTGLVIRTMVAKFYVELAYGFLKVGAPGTGWSKASGSFNALIGTQPFDLWTRK